MSRFIEGEDRSQATLFPGSLDEYIAEDSAVRLIDVERPEEKIATLREEIQRLKKRKLLLKDEISRLQDMLLPDIIA